MGDENLTPVSQPKKSKLWIWIVLGLVALCVAGFAILALVFGVSFWSLLQQASGAPILEISEGTYDGTRYTLSDGTFSCNYADVTLPGFTLYDKRRDDFGAVWSSDDFGSDSYVEYWILPDEYIATLTDAKSQKDELKIWADNYMDGDIDRSTTASVISSEYVNDQLYFLATKVPGTSYLVEQTSGVALDMIHARYFFFKNSRLYVVGSASSPILSSSVGDPDGAALQSRLDDFYRGCAFQ